MDSTFFSCGTKTFFWITMMMNRWISALALGFVLLGSGCGTSEPTDLNASVSETSQSRLIDVLETTYPELHNDIVVQAATPNDEAVLFLVSKGGTYLLRRGDDPVPERIDHAKFIAPNSITHITYQERTFRLWSGEELQLTLTGYP